MTLNLLLLSRLQWVWVISWHILLPAFTIGLASYIALLEGLAFFPGRAAGAGGLRDIVAVASSRATGAAALGISMLTDDIPRETDLTIDGADKVDPAPDLIKGGGGALLRKKVVAQASRREVIVVDGSKLSAPLGTHDQPPAEVLNFRWRSVAYFLESLGAAVTPRAGNGGPYRADQGHMIPDCRFGPMTGPAVLSGVLGARAGIVEHGLSVGIAQDLIVASTAGVRHVQRGSDPAAAG